MSLTLTGEFKEFDEFTEFTAAWDIDFRQTSRGTLNAKLLQTVSKPCSFARAQFNQSTYQQGKAVSGMRSFAIFKPSSPGSHWCGQSLTPGRIGIFAPDGEFTATAKANFDVFTLSFDERELALACQRLGIPDVGQKLPASALVREVDQRRADVICKQVNFILMSLCQASHQEHMSINNLDISDTITENLVMLLTDSTLLEQTPSQQRQSQVLKLATDIIEDSLDDCISVRDLAAALNVSIRTLEYSFRNKFGTTPKLFINMQRLLQVRRELLTANNENSITHIANRWGFWHMGQFAQDYRKMFGELPSQTRSTVTTVMVGST